eukprot:TRINITY_DN28322_c0_g1_i1.p1 TRINITY_DN28322_c0_g1~~TRINITY_DN28322_c0_g1_i1.p1  ORF type:complete len:201 (-),score=39.85 TRINITY_DN28322_c0_g1_i1:519-1121(-)
MESRAVSARWQRRHLSSALKDLKLQKVEDEHQLLETQCQAPRTDQPDTDPSSVLAGKRSGPRHPDRLRWRRQVESESNGVPLKLLNASEDESAASCAVRGLCPKSKLSLMGSARLLQAPDLAKDFTSVLTGGAHHLKHIFCGMDERKLFQELQKEVVESGLWRTRWSASGKDSYEWTIAPAGGQRSTGRIKGEVAKPPWT